MKKLSPRAAKNIALDITILCGLALVAVKYLWPQYYRAEFWIAPAFFFIYETVFVWLLGRSAKMEPAKGVNAMLIMRAVKFLCAAALMLVYVKVVVTGKNFFLIYTLFYYIITSLFEAVATAAMNRK